MLVMREGDDGVAHQGSDVRVCLTILIIWADQLGGGEALCLRVVLMEDLGLVKQDQ